MTALGRDFFARAAPKVAVDLLGCVVWQGEVAVRICEVEAYSQEDPASHSFNGPTPARRTMFGPPGHLYVYFTYGMHHCGNLTCDAEGTGAGVLLRAGEVISGEEVARQRRGSAVADRDLARGPARLAQAMGWDRSCDGRDMASAVFPRPGSVTFERGPRVGVSKAADTPWRFSIVGDRFVSPYRRHPRATA